MFESTKVILEIEKTCRTCLTEKTPEELTSIWENHLNSRISEVTNVELKANSIFPNHICTDCLKTLNIARDFQKQVQQSEYQLRNLIFDEEFNQPTVVFKSFTLLDDGAISEDCLGSLKEVINQESLGDSVLIVENVNVQNNTQPNSKSALKEQLENSEGINNIATDNCIESLTYFRADDNSGNNNEVTQSDTLLTSNNVIKWAESLRPSNENFTDNNHGTDIKLNFAREGIETELVEDDVEELKVEAEEAKPFKIVNFCCDFCSKTFRFEFIYKKHLLKHGYSMECEICLSQFNDATAYLFHVKNSHPSLKPFTCPCCKERFFTMSPLKEHFKRHSVGNRKKFECDICGRMFLKQSSLITHQKNHSNPEAFQCEVCNKKLSGQHSLLNHLKIHREDKRHKCETCGATFIHRFSLRAHLRTHTGEKPFECKLCSSKFKTSSYLKIHLRTHTAEKPYQCTICLKSFVCKSALVAHEKAHTGEKKFQCDICGWRSARSSDLHIHMRKHSGEKPYKCELCSKRYKTTSHLAAHRKTHLGLKEHICSICNKAFGDPRTLKGHIRIHTGETPYMCHVCGRRFKQSGQLSSHRKIHQIKTSEESAVV